jgi:hypothetical protein
MGGIKMANVTIAGNSYVITSAVSMADLEAVRKYRPSALKITDPETQETLFKVSTGANSMSDYGISFGGVSNDDAKLATATLPIPLDIESAKEYVLDKAGIAIASLNKIEAGIADALKEIRAEREALSKNIKVSV